MTDNINTRPPAVNIPETPAEERSEYISDARMYNEEELAFIRTRDEVNKRSITEMKKSIARLDESIARDRESIARLDESIARDRESIARDRESIARGRESLAKLDALIAELKGKQNSK